MYCLNEEGRLLNVTPDPKEWIETRSYITKRDYWRKKENQISDLAMEMYRMQLRLNPDPGSTINKRNLKEILPIIEKELFPEDYDPTRIINFYDKSRRELYEWYTIIKGAL